MDFCSHNTVKIGEKSFFVEVIHLFSYVLKYSTVAGATSEQKLAPECTEIRCHQALSNHSVVLIMPVRLLILTPV